jgi:hypothetical protein
LLCQKGRHVNRLLPDRVADCEHQSILRTFASPEALNLPSGEKLAHLTVSLCSS